MTIEEAVKTLKKYPTDLDAVPDAAVSERNFRSALKMAIEALEKQTPKKVIDHDYCIAEYGDSGCQVGGIFRYKATCPTCNNTIADGEFEKSDLIDIKFCDSCGQMIDWGLSELEEEDDDK